MCAAMKIRIDNLLGQGPVDYTGALDPSVAPRIMRKLNRPAQLTCSLMESAAGFVTPVIGARVVAQREDGSYLFTGYLTGAPRIEYLGWGERGSVCRQEIVAESDEILLDLKALPTRAPFVMRSAGAALKQLAQDLLPGGLDTSAVEDVDTVAWYEVNPQKKFSEHAADLALSVRASYRALDNTLVFAPAGKQRYSIEESDANFSPMGLKLECVNQAVNDVTVLGLVEPQAYVRDYFVGDGKSLRFYLSQTPLQQRRPVLIDEEYAGPDLNLETWNLSDPAGAISVAAQAVSMNGGTGVDGQTTVAFVEQIELGGALELQHGDVSFSGISQGILGGLYNGTISAAACVAGFQIASNVAGTTIQALIQGMPTGPVVNATAGHRYVLTTYMYATEVYRSREKYHSAEKQRGGGLIPADVRFVLQVQDIDPANPATMVAAAIVLYDGVVANAPGFCTYGLVNAVTMKCAIAYTYARHISLAEVRTALPNSDYVTQTVGPLSDGTKCQIAGSTSLDFYPQYVPALNTLIVASYRGAGRALARVVDATSIAKLQSGTDDGVRGDVRAIKLPSARTQADCENAALAVLDDGVGQAWRGSYETWSDFLPGGARDIFPGDEVSVDVPSRGAEFTAIVRTINIEVADPSNDRGIYRIEFANDLAAPLTLQTEKSGATISLQDKPVRLATTDVGSYYAGDLNEARATEVTSTTVSVDAGVAPGAGHGIEVRAHDYGWGVANDRNLLGRFSTQTFTLPRLARTQNYFLRLYDSSSPPHYSRYAAALHVDYPL